MAKPTIILVPGAWHKALESFHLLTTLLGNHGYVVEAVPLASVGQSLPRLGFEEDVKNVATVIEKHADQGSDIVVLFHSYGGVPGSSACRHLLKSDRSAVGKAGGITHVVYCAAFAIEEGRCLMDGMGGQPLPWWVFDESEESMMPEDPENTFLQRHR
ncbi:hypothetical protein M409DRAFT_55707 [Zasmidium cellare ATCC 36951]|uniref:AB hydrolase-1 domain-containing protein n=1 Tax=Zasmidium cellare ATCC 36951 TaxID=1080233 RepID=A0A6A6CDL7_ZASCE|nr:uncharacterized protein M409DRAFT_55707 [Zasmidium cellare ATCC 36951]KAF2165284.1 hypothetical protein M409DRAFT_55707 [Zasmidium cellare ATCC 36951]